MSTEILTGARIFDGSRFHQGAGLAVAGGRVAALGPVADLPEGTQTALPGGYLVPGFIDLQVNGGGGVMLGAEGTVEEIATICRAHLQAGTTGLLPTLITATPEMTARVIEAGIAAARQGVPGFLGLHLEGPHLDPKRKGAHDPALIRPMRAPDLDRLIAAARALPHLMVTLAPAAATPEQIAALARAGAVVSLGHSDTDLASARAAFEAGAACVTHLFNAMSQLGHRAPGLVGAALDTPQVHAGLICDGIHVAPEALRVAFHAKAGAERLFAVTDAMAVAGTTLEAFDLGGRRILRRDGRLTLADGTLAGADITLPAALRYLTGTVGLSLEAALRTMTTTPAACIGAARGRLAPGVAADLIWLTPDLAVGGVWQGGRKVA